LEENCQIDEHEDKKRKNNN